MKWKDKYENLWLTYAHSCIKKVNYLKENEYDDTTMNGTLDISKTANNKNIKMDFDVEDRRRRIN